MRRIASNAVGRIRRSFSRRHDPSRVVPVVLPPPPPPTNPPPNRPPNRPEFITELDDLLWTMPLAGRAFWFNEHLRERRLWHDYVHSAYTTISEWADNYPIDPDDLARVTAEAQQVQDELDMGGRDRYIEQTERMESINLARLELERDPENAISEVREVARLGWDPDTAITEVREGVFGDAMERERMQEDADERRETEETEVRDWFPGM